MIPAAVITVDPATGLWTASVALTNGDWLAVTTEADGHGARTPDDPRLDREQARAFADLIQQVGTIQEATDGQRFDTNVGPPARREQRLETATALPAAGRAPATTASDPTCSVVAGPHGHWYAYADDQLLGWPQSATDDIETDAPQHPTQMTDPYGAGQWYEVYDLVGDEREQVLKDLGCAPVGKFAVAPMGGIPGEGDVALFDTETEAAAHAKAAVDEMPAPTYDPSLRRVPGSKFAAVVQITEPDWGWTPYGWVDDRGEYEGGSFEESEYLWPGQVTHTNDLTQLLVAGRDAKGDHALTVTLLLDGRRDDDDSIGGMVVDLDSGARRFQLEDPQRRVLEWLDYARIQRAWLTDLRGDVVLEYPTTETLTNG